MAAVPQRFGFIFPLASGHINPSLAVARYLVDAGHEVHYLCREQMRSAIEDTGATFHSEIEELTELYATREPHMFGAIEDLKKELGIEQDTMVEAMSKTRCIQLELMLPGAMRWLQRLDIKAVMCCPMMNLEAICACKVLNIPCISIITTAGPGSMPRAFKEFMEMFGMTVEKLKKSIEAFQPHVDATARLNAKYGLGLSVTENMEPMGQMNLLRHCHVNLVTTSKDLQDPLDPEIAEAYDRMGARFECVGALLDHEGAKRAAGHKIDVEEDASHDSTDTDASAIVAKVAAARAAGRPVVLVSMGTVITGDHPEVGWEARLMGPDGVKAGLTGRELCQAAWSGAFDAFGSASEDDGPLMVVALGPQKDALGDLVVPANAVCAPVVPQVDVLKAGVQLFLTHGGQNSFTEGIANAAPLVVCPGFADQPVNARKAEALGVGLQVPRPMPKEGDEVEAAKVFRADVAAALRRVREEPAFAAAAADHAERLSSLGGVPRAAEVVLQAAAARVNCEKSPPQATSLNKGIPGASLAGGA